LIFTSGSTRAPGQECRGFLQSAFVSSVPVAQESPRVPASLAVMLRDDFFDQMRQGIPAALQDATR